ncbi:MAG: hypothetical protein ACYCX4_13255 [Bacillota bacterium]
MIIEDVLSSVKYGCQKKGLLRKFIRLSCQLSEALHAELPEELETILNQIDQIIKDVDHVDTHLKVLIGGIDKTFAFEFQQQWSPLKEEIDSLLVKAKEICDLNQLNLLGKKEIIANMLKTVREGKKGLAMYEGKHVHIEGIFLDKKR